MTRRERIGSRKYRLTATQHDGTIDDDHGTPTLGTPGDWDAVVTGWPCERLAAGGGETLRGRQVTASATTVFFGEYQGGKAITTDMRVTVESVTYSVVAAYDQDGDGREFRVEAKREI